VEGIEGDVFLPRKEAEKAMHGDRILAHVSRVGREGRADGKLVRILKRAHTTVVGEFRIKKRGNFV
jgi:ribonuclease R